MAGDFRGAKLKIERAKQHINNLNTLGQIFLNTHPHILSVELNTETGKDTLSIARADPPPDEFVLILGDAIHNLRTALDHAWIQVLSSTTSHSKFPFHETQDDFENAIGSLKDRASEEVKRFMIERVQPYRGGKCEMLLDLHNLDIKDKHWLLIAHREFTFVTGITAVDDRGEEFSIGEWLVAPDRIASQSFEGHDHFKITNCGQGTTRVTFGEGMPLQGRFLMPTLHALTEIVRLTVETLEAAFRFGREGT